MAEQRIIVESKARHNRLQFIKWAIPIMLIFVAIMVTSQKDPQAWMAWLVAIVWLLITVLYTLFKRK